MKIKVLLDLLHIVCHILQEQEYRIKPILTVPYFSSAYINSVYTQSILTYINSV